MSKTRLNVITAGIMLSIFLASMEGTVVATAMPTIVAQLGGLSIYSWVFSIYMLASTTTVPIYGKLSDIYGRKPVYGVSMLLFLTGSVLCAQAQSMEQLVIFRAVQGLGAGGILPLAFTIIGEIFSLEDRAKMQGWISGVWGVSAVIGPLVGGFLVDQVSWHWVFLINLFPGAFAAALVMGAWQRRGTAHETQVTVDYPGAALLTLGVLALLLGLDQPGGLLGFGSLILAAILLTALYFVERRAVDPILPLHLFRDRLFIVTLLHGVLAGWAMFGSINFIPLFVQAVLGTDATQAGISLTPMSLCWTIASIFGGNLMLRMGYRTLALIGMVLLTVGAFLMSRIGANASLYTVMIYVSLMGTGMGLSVPAFLIAVQSTVPRQDLGAATSTVQFSRSIGGTIGVSVMGAFLSSALANRLLSAGMNPATVKLESLLDPVAGAGATLAGPVRNALAGSIANLFLIAFVAALLGLIAVIFAPPGKISQLAQKQPVEKIPDQLL